MKNKWIATGIFVLSLMSTSVFAQDTAAPENNYKQDTKTTYSRLNTNLNQSIRVAADINLSVLKVQLDDRIANHDAKVLLYNAKGGLIEVQTMKNDNTTVFSMENQRQGVYIVRYVQDGEIVTKKIYYQ